MMEIAWLKPVWIIALAESSDQTLNFTLSMIVLAILLVLLNGFFVAAEFALVKVRPSQINKMADEGLPFAQTAKWLVERLDHSLSACQLGITMASLALGYVGEPAFARLFEPVFHGLGVTSANWIHVFSFIIAFSIITSFHLVIGEQAPKIFAIRRPESMVRWCAMPMWFFFYLLFPFMYVLNGATEKILGWLGMSGSTGHGLPHNEEEIRALLREAHVHGHFTRSEHTMLNAVFEFDDMICRLVMVPRAEVEIMDINKPFPELLSLAKETKHTRYPLCDGSFDNLLGVVHMKDLLGIDQDDNEFDLRTVMRPPVKVPENMPISQVLRTIQTTHQLLTFVVDEYGMIIGVATLENVLEKIIGPVDDEFDLASAPMISKISASQFLVLGQTPILEVERALDLNMDDEDVDTVAGVLMSRSGKIPEKGDRIEFDGAVAEIVSVKNDHAEKIRFTLTEAENP
jgi:CBS domain containing-hemolysin-like protein